MIVLYFKYTLWMECQNKESKFIKLWYNVDLSKHYLVNSSLFSSPNNCGLHPFTCFHSKNVLSSSFWKFRFGISVACTNFCLGKQWKESYFNFYYVAGSIIGAPFSSLSMTTSIISDKKKKKMKTIQCLWNEQCKAVSWHLIYKTIHKPFYTLYSFSQALKIHLVIYCTENKIFCQLLWLLASFMILFK